MIEETEITNRGICIGIDRSIDLSIHSQKISHWALMRFWQTVFMAYSSYYLTVIVWAAAPCNWHSVFCLGFGFRFDPILNSFRNGKSTRDMNISHHYLIGPLLFGRFLSNLPRFFMAQMNAEGLTDRQTDGLFVSRICNSC